MRTRMKVLWRWRHVARMLYAAFVTCTAVSATEKSQIMRTRMKVLWRGRHVARMLYAAIVTCTAVSACELGREWFRLPPTSWGIKVVITCAVVEFVGLSWLLSMFIRGGLEEIARDAHDTIRTLAVDSSGEQRSAVGSPCTSRENDRLREGLCPDCGSRLKCATEYDWSGQTVVCESDDCAASFIVAEPFGVRVSLARLSASKRSAAKQE